MGKCWWSCSVIFNDEPVTDAAAVLEIMRAMWSTVSGFTEADVEDGGGGSEGEWVLNLPTADESTMEEIEVRAILLGGEAVISGTCWDN